MKKGSCSRKDSPRTDSAMAAISSMGLFWGGRNRVRTRHDAQGGMFRADASTHVALLQKTVIQNQRACLDNLAQRRRVPPGRRPSRAAHRVVDVFGGGGGAAGGAGEVDRRSSKSVER